MSEKYFRQDTYLSEVAKQNIMPTYLIYVGSSEAAPDSLLSFCHIVFLVPNNIVMKGLPCICVAMFIAIWWFPNYTALPCGGISQNGLAGSQHRALADRAGAARGAIWPVMLHFHRVTFPDSYYFLQLQRDFSSLPLLFTIIYP